MSWRDNPEFINNIVRKFRDAYPRAREVAKLYLPITSENVKKLILFNTKSWRKLKMFMRGLNMARELPDQQLRFRRTRAYIESQKQQIEDLRDDLCQEYFDF